MTPEDAIRDLKRERAAWADQRMSYLSQIRTLKAEIATLYRLLDRAEDRANILAQQVTLLHHSPSQFVN
jgi:hypothetical protein